MEPSPSSGAPAAAGPRRPPLRWLALASASVAVAAALAWWLLVALGGSGGGGAGPASPPTTDRPATAVPDGRPAPDLRLPALDGEGTVALGAGVSVVNVWASWCGPCREEAPALQAIWEDYRARGVRVLGVDHLDRREAGRAFVREFGLTYPSGFDPDGRFVRDQGVPGLPATLVIADGRVAFRLVGPVGEDLLREILDGLLGPAP